jgi:hypothetical protein
VLAAAGLLAWGVGSAGAHGGDTSKVHSCVVASSGYAQIIGANETCSKNYRALDWSATDTNTTYSAGFGLSLSSANSFSVTGAPWGGLTDVPAGFSDGVDNVGSTAWSGLTGVPAGFADNVDDEGSKAWGDLTGVPSGFADNVDDAGSMKWSDLTGVPLEFADGDDDDGSAGLAQLVSQLSNADGTPNEPGDPVSFTKVKDLTSTAGGRILGSFIQNGTIQSDDVADGAIQGRDLGNVLVTTTESVDPPALPAGSARGAVTVAITGVKAGDLVTVSPPQVLDDGLVFAGSDVLTDGVVTIYLHNVTGAPLDGAPRTWTVRYLDTNG